MKIHSFQGNNEFVSRRCPMNDGCFTSRQVVADKGWSETSHSTPVKKRCSLFRGICLILGAFVEMVGENSSYSVYEIASAVKNFQKSASTPPSSPNFIVQLFQGCPEKFQISSQMLRKNQTKNNKKV